MFWDKSVWPTQYCEKAFVFSQNHAKFALQYEIS